MTVPLKRELCDTTVNVAVPASLKEAVRRFAEENGVTQGAAVRHILSLFFAGDFVNSKVNHQKRKEPRKKG
jgi:hypothetical protein